jgi:lysophospholipase L1-like esterase
VGYWAASKDPRLEFRNCGVYGQRTDEIAARLDVCGDGADALVVQGGINDIAQGRSVEEAAANLRLMVRRARELDLPITLADVLPWNNGYPDAETEIRRLNALIAQICVQEGVPLLPFHDTLEDPDAPGRMRPEWTSDGDHTHPSRAIACWASGPSTCPKRPSPSDSHRDSHRDCH